MAIMWKFKTKHFTVIWEITEDELYTKYMDEDYARECRQKVRSGEWRCFQSEIRVIENVTKVALGNAYLGGSIYANPADFRDHFGMNAGGYGSYFSDMVREAIAEARKTLPEHQARIEKIVKAQKKFLALKLRTKKQVTA